MPFNFSQFKGKPFADFLPELRSYLAGYYPETEANSLLFWAAEEVTGKSKAALMVGFEPTHEQWERLLAALQRLAQHEPVQHIFGKAYFMDLVLKVSPEVLIPRPETEELTTWIINDWRQHPPFALLDMGTGSGCLAIACAKHLPQATVHALDVSETALKVAAANARQNRAKVHFMLMDVLTANASELPKVAVLVSNPPYVRESEKQLMQRNVLNFEPAQALFVTDDDPLIFYRKLAELGKEILQPNGALYLEINEALGKETARCCAEILGGEVLLQKDMQGKDRMLKVKKLG